MTQTKKKTYKTALYPLFSVKMRHLDYKPVRKMVKNPPAVAIHRGNLCQKKFTGKELDSETGLYYYGARYLDPRVSRWLSGDPAMAEYIPSAPVNEKARKRNGNLPGMGGVFNYVNLHVYHYAGNNPVKYTDPDGNYLINNIAGNVVVEGVEYSIRDYATNIPASWLIPFTNIAMLLMVDHENLITPRFISQGDIGNIIFENNLNNKLSTVESINKTESKMTTATVTANAKRMNNGLYQIDLTVTIYSTNPLTGEIITDTTTGTIAFANSFELLVTPLGVNQSQVNNIANKVLEIANFNIRVDE